MNILCILSGYSASATAEAKNQPFPKLPYMTPSGLIPSDPQRFGFPIINSVGLFHVFWQGGWFPSLVTPAYKNLNIKCF